jgi:RNA 3'-terminal phosphate cyclase (ATP)
MIELDGAAGEGGGQILRSSLALSLCTGQPMTIRRIRARRPKPGLMRQHLACVNAAVAISGAKAEGAELGSQQLVFEPGAVRPGDYSFNVGTAGSCSLVLQTILPPLMMAQSTSRVVLGGGTHNPMAPPFHFLERCFAPLLSRLGVGLALELRRMGFYPAGGGEFSALITPATGGLVPVDLIERGALRGAYAECLAPGLPSRVASRELEAVGRLLGWTPEQLIAPAVRQNEGPGNALMATLVHEHVTELVTAFGEKGVSSEAVAASLSKEVQAFQRAAGALGPHLADQWMLPLALAVVGTKKPASFTCTEMTDHSSTNIGVIEAFLPVQFEVAESDPSLWRVSVATKI